MPARHARLQVCWNPWFATLTDAQVFNRLPDWDMGVVPESFKGVSVHSTSIFYSQGDFII